MGAVWLRWGWVARRIALSTVPLGFGHSGLANPKGWQKVAGGRRGLRGRRPPDSCAGDGLHPGWGARLISERRVKRASVERIKAKSGPSIMQAHEGHSAWSPGLSRPYAVSPRISKCFEPLSTANALPAKAGTPYMSGTSLRLLSTCARILCLKERSRLAPRWGALSQNTSSGGRSPVAPNDHRLPFGNPPGWLRLQSGEWPRLFRNGRRTPNAETPGARGSRVKRTTDGHR